MTKAQWLENYEDKMDLIGDTALATSAAGHTMKCDDLADLLNSKGIKTNYGTAFKYGRGMHILVRCAYQYYEKLGDVRTCDAIDLVYVDKNGNRAQAKGGRP